MHTASESLNSEIPDHGLPRDAQTPDSRPTSAPPRPRGQATLVIPMRSLLAQGACKKPTLCHQAVGLRRRGGHEGSVGGESAHDLAQDSVRVRAHLAVHS